MVRNVLDGLGCRSEWGSGLTPISIPSLLRILDMGGC